MSKHARIAHLTWLRAPIQRSIDTAKVHLDAYHKKSQDLATPPADAQPIWYTNQMVARDEALNRIRTEVALIHSSLVVAECSGAAALAHEIKILLSNIQNSIHAAGRVDDALVSVMTGLLTIPKYVSMVIDGAPDTPVILAKQINELRELRGVQLLEEGNILPPGVEFTFVDPPRKNPECGQEQRNRTFGAAPKRFQTAFSTYMGTQSKAALGEMRTVLQELQDVTYDQEVGCFWWIGECLIDAIESGAIRNAGNTLSQIRMLSVAVQKAASGGEEAARDTLGVARFKSLLGVLTMSSRLPAEVEAALATFNVRAATDQSKLDALQARLDEAQVDSLKEVVTELKPLLETSMVSLGRAISSKNQQGFDAQISTFRTSLRQVASVFYMVNEDTLAAVATRILTRVDRVTGANSFTNAELIEELKGDFMFLDQRIHSLNVNEVIRSLDLPGIGPDVIEAVVGQAVRELAITRRLIAQHMDSGTGSEDLRAGLERLLATANALSFSGLTRAGQVLNGSCQGFMNLLQNGAIKASPGADLAARALVAVETYLGAVGENLVPSPLLLSRAEEGLAELGIRIEHSETVTPTALIAMFEAAKSADPTDDDHFLAEMFELRAALEQVVPVPDVRHREIMEHLYKTSDRLAIAAKLYGHDFFSRLARAIALAANSLRERAPDSELDAKRARDLIKAGIDMALRCMDEYSARGTVSIYTREVETGLLAIADPDARDTSQSAQPTEVVNAADEPTLEVRVVVPSAVLAPSEDSLRPYPDGVDGVLMEIYREEFVNSHRVLLAFCANGDGVVTNDARRAAHSIYGNSANAGCEVLRSVYGALEERLDGLAAEGTTLSSAYIEQFLILLNETGEFLENFPWTMDTPLREAWIDTATSLGDDIQDAKFEALPPPQPAPAENIPHAETQATAEAAVPAVAAAVEREYNDEYEFYLDEADDVLPEMLANVNGWLEDMSNRELITTIKRQMHTLKGAALMAEASSIGAIAHAMESLFESLSIQLIAPDDDCAQLVSFALDAIANLTALMRQQLPYAPPVLLMRCLEHAVDSNAIDLSILLSEHEPTTSATAPAAEPVPAAPNKIPAADELAAQPEQPAQSAKTTGEGSASPVASEQPAQVAGVHKRTRRRGRGQGGAKRHAEMRAEQAAEQVVQDQPVQRAGQMTSDHVTLKGDPKLDSSLPVPDPVSAPDIPVGAVSAADIPTQQQEALVEGQPEAVTDPSPGQTEILHAESSSAARPLRNQSYEEEAADEFDRLYSFDNMQSEQPSGPIVSATLQQMLARDADVGSSSGKKGPLVAAEKIKVDLKLLETASEQSSELTAIRHRLEGLNEDLLLRLSTVRERMDSSSLQHGQFTTALRGVLNSQPVARNPVDGEFAGLERFNELSAMHVAMVAQFEDIREEFADTIMLSRQIRAAVREQGMLIGSLQRDLLDSRLVPFMNVKPKLMGAMKQATASTKKEVDLTILGAEVIMDRMILDSVAEPLTHILRNAVDHGIELAEQRVAAGKKPSGRIEITVYRRAKNVIISVVDDGRGISIPVVRKKAIEKGIISETDMLTDKEIMRLITASGFSTASQITSVSGRGVGMDIVASAVDGLGGQLHIDSAEGQGTTFTIELPFTIGANKAMMVSSGTQWFAIQSYSITQVLMISCSALQAQREANGYAVVEHDGVEFEVVHLADLIAMPDSRGTSAREKETILLLCEQGDTRIAVEVSLVDSMPEIHIRKLEGVLSQVRGIVGETEMQDGTVVFVLDVIELARLNLKRGQDGYQVRQNRIRSMKRDQKPVVMIIDDSKGYRTMLERVFTGFGYIVVSAVNGQDALDKLPLERGPDLFVVDVEMPRKTGFEFTAEIRTNPAYKATPIIMITTKHEFEPKAKAAGVNEFLKKPFDVPTLEQAVTNVKAQMPREHAV